MKVSPFVTNKMNREDCGLSSIFSSTSVPYADYVRMLPLHNPGLLSIQELLARRVIHDVSNPLLKNFL